MTQIGSTSVPVHLLKIEPRNGEELATPELRRGLARQIAREARDLLSDDKGYGSVPKDETKRIEPGDIYVLTATNKDAQQVSQRSARAGVPFAFYKQEGLFQTDQAREIRDLLAAIDDPADAAKRGRAWITPFFAVPLAALPDLADLPDSHPLIERLRTGTNWRASVSSRGCSRGFLTTVESFAASCSSKTMSEA